MTYAVKRFGDNTPFLTQCRRADSMLSRVVGLLNRESLGASEALLLEPCSQVHMFFMRFAIDAIFLDASNTIVATESLKPWRLSKLHFKARKVLEAPMGTAERASLKAGDKLEFTPC